MSISPVGNSDPYERYRQQQLDLLASPTQASTQNTPTTSPSYVVPASSTDQTSSNPFAAKFKADLTALNSPRDGASGPQGAHGHHHHHSGGPAASSTQTNLIDPNNPADSTDSTSSTDPFSLALDQFADVVKATSDSGAA
jgi:hypothetical protein